MIKQPLVLYLCSKALFSGLAWHGPTLKKQVSGKRNPEVEFAVVVLSAGTTSVICFVITNYRAGSASMIAWWWCCPHGRSLRGYHSVFCVHLMAHLISSLLLLTNCSLTVCCQLDSSQITVSTHLVLMLLLSHLSPLYVLVSYFIDYYCVSVSILCYLPWQFCLLYSCRSLA